MFKWNNNYNAAQNGNKLLLSSCQVCTSCTRMVNRTFLNKDVETYVSNTLLHIYCPKWQLVRFTYLN